jgi:hypothetical protein
MGVLTDEVQLGYALEAFSMAHQKPPGWATRTLLHLCSAGINSMGDLQTGCKENTINLDLELFGVSPEDRLSQNTIQHLRSFLPGPVGLRCFRLAQRAAEKVKKGGANTQYVHRPAAGGMGKEEFSVPVDDDWTLSVDCAGFVRSCLKHVTKDPFLMTLSDRNFMRAKDFFSFFQFFPYSIMDKDPIPETDKRMRWRIVGDLRRVIPGDVIVYRPRGNSAGGGAFTAYDRKNMGNLLRATKVAQLWAAATADSETRLTPINFAKDPSVKPWVDTIRNKLKAIGVITPTDFRKNFDSINDMLRAKDFIPLKQDTLQLMKECAETTALNTGHIVFAAGPAAHVGNNQYRIRVIHSTKDGYVDENGNKTEGVQEYFRRFQMVEHSDGRVSWTREVSRSQPPPIDEDDDNPNDDMDNETDEEDELDDKPAEDELAGQSDVEVLAARMCF